MKSSPISWSRSSESTGTTMFFFCCCFFFYLFVLFPFFSHSPWLPLQLRHASCYLTEIASPKLFNALYKQYFVSRSWTLGEEVPDRVLFQVVLFLCVLCFSFVAFFQGPAHHPCRTA